MKKQEILEECREKVENGADMLEIFEWVEDNTDLDPAEVINHLFIREYSK